jgi:hypothetical protein
VVDHAKRYVDGNVHTNMIENFWSLPKRMLKGTYISVEPFHLFRYLDEQALRYNYRKANDGERFGRVMHGIIGKRLTYKNRPARLALRRCSPRLVDAIIAGIVWLPRSRLKGVVLRHAERRQPIQLRLCFPALREGDEGAGSGSKKRS